jgi:hypothetical protein
MTMIREHAFNSAWWGDKAGFVEDATLFTLPDAEREAILRDYAWVEYVAPIDTVAPAALLRAGFMQTDVQIVFKLDLRRLPPLPDFANLSIASAAEEPFHIGDDELGEFEHERFRYLPGITPAKLKDRYRRWANALIDANATPRPPACCSTNRRSPPMPSAASASAARASASPIRRSITSTPTSARASSRRMAAGSGSAHPSHPPTTEP